MRKFIQNKFLIIEVILAIAGCIAVAMFLNYDSEVKVHNYKTWEVLFDKPLSKAQMGNMNVTITNSQGAQEKISFNWISNNDVLIYPPSEGYKLNEQYTLDIKTDLDFKLDRKLDKRKSTKFKIINTGSSDKNLSFVDKNLEAAVRKAVNKPKGALKVSDVEKLDSLVATSAGITKLDGIENLYNLRTLMLDMNSIEEIGPLKSLTDLEKLGLSHNSIKNASPINKLTSLVSLSLYGNPTKSYTSIKSITNGLEWKDFTDK